MPAKPQQTPLDFVHAVEELKASGAVFVLHPESWRRCTGIGYLKWQEVQFTASARGAIPSERGVYAFIVRPSGDGFPPHGYLMYVGITGDTSTHRSLRKRYGNYLAEQRVRKRPAIHYMLTKWKDDVYFCYAPVSDRRISLARLERKLNDAFLPPCSKNDLSAEIRQRRAAF